MDKKYIITRQGKDFILYEGLLDEAHRQGLKRISTQLVQIPHEDNGHMAVVTAEVETGQGIFSGIGDASPQNVNRMIVPHLLRMAETRAKARALRDATNMGQAAAEELADFDQMTPEVGDQEPDSSAEPPTQDGQTPSSKAANANQLSTIVKLSRLLGYPDKDWSNLTSAEASEQITRFSREYNDRRSAGGSNPRHTQPMPQEAKDRADQLMAGHVENMSGNAMNDRWLAAKKALIDNGWTDRQLLAEAWRDTKTAGKVGDFKSLSQEQRLAIIEWAEREVAKLSPDVAWAEVPDEVLAGQEV